MRRASVAYLGFAMTLGGLLGLVGCGRFSFETREPWRRQAEEACLSAGHVRTSAYMSFGKEIDGPGSCGITWPVRASAFAGGTVGLTSRVTLACPIIPSINVWLAKTVQPAAELYFGQRVVDLRAGSYNCRGRNNQYGAKVSEHGYGNALDVMAFRLADGREVTVKGGWRGDAVEQDFLREVFVGACSYFTTVLGPGSDMFHYDHFHLDLARHDPAQRRHICKPIIKFEPRLPIGGGEARATPPPAPTLRAAPAEPDQEFEAADDPYAVSKREPPAASRTGSIARSPSRGVSSALTDYMSFLGLGGDRRNPSAR
jgi:hypothetical protein